MIGAVPRERYDPEEVVTHFHAWLVEHRAGRTLVPDLETFAAGRGAVRKGGDVDLHNAAQSYIRAFNEGAFGRISFETPDDGEDEQTA
jgi:ribosome biogenesis GTPase A